MNISPPPTRIVSLAPSNTEILFALGLGDRVVGVDDDSDWPGAVAGLPRVGRDLQIDVERVAALRPDLVLAARSVPGMERCVAAVAARGLPHLTLAPESLADVLDDLERVGVACGVPGAANALRADLEGRIAAVRAATAPLGTARPTVYWEWWPRPRISPGRRSWMVDLLDLAGARQLCAEADVTSLVVADEAIRAADPDAIVLCWCGARKLVPPAKVAARPGWSDLRAVREGRVYTLLEAAYGRPGPRLIAGLETLCGLLHPGLSNVGDAAFNRAVRHGELRIPTMRAHL